MLDKTLLEVSPYDTADYLKTDEIIQACLNEVLSQDDPSYFLRALRTVARAKGMAKVALAVGMPQENLSQCLSEKSTPDFHTLWHVLKALGCRLRIEVAPTAADTPLAQAVAMGQ